MPMNLTRQTDLSFERIKEILSRDTIENCKPATCRSTPPEQNLGLLWNEVGVIYWCQEKDAKKAEEFLRQALNSESEIRRYYGYAYLSQERIDKSPKTISALSNFRKNKDNTKVIGRVEGESVF